MLKIATVDTTPLSFITSSPGNLREYPHKPYIARNWSQWPTFLPLNDTMGLSSFKFLWWALKDASFLQQYKVNFGTIERAYATSYKSLWSYLALFLRYGDLLVEKCEFSPPHPHLMPLLGVNPFEFLDNFIQKTRILGLSVGEVFRYPSLHRFDTVPACDRRTDRQPNCS